MSTRRIYIAGRGGCWKTVMRRLEDWHDVNVDSKNGFGQASHSVATEKRYTRRGAAAMGRDDVDINAREAYG
jgi:hypothetical protein